MTIKLSWSIARAVGAALLLPSLAAGCLRRQDLTAAELKRVEDTSSSPSTSAPPRAEAALVQAAPAPVAAEPTRHSLEQLRVFVGRKLRAYYPQAKDPLDYNLTGGRIRLRGAHRPLVTIVGRNVPGKVIDEDTLNGMRRLWVTFDERCAERACAYGFVYTGRLDRFSLVDVPPEAGFKAPLTYRRARLKRNRLRPQKQRSLAELNEVLAVKRRHGKKVLTVNLQVRKDTWRPTWVTRQRPVGVGKPRD